MHLVRANALHERNHGGEDHPVPCRTRQLSSPSPKVLRCSPWEDRPFRSCRAFPLSRALRALFLFGAHAPPAGAAPLGRAARARSVPSPRSSRIGPKQTFRFTVWEPDCPFMPRTQPSCFIAQTYIISLFVCFAFPGKPCIDQGAFTTVQLEGPTILG